MGHGMKKPDKPAAPGSAPAMTVVLRSLKNPPLDMSLPAQPLTTSVLELKQKVASELGLDSVDKIRVLHKKKPAVDSKSIKDIMGEDQGKTLELNVMIMGGMPEKSSDPPKTSIDAEMPDAPVAQGESGSPVMQSAEFWSDLQGFLMQRVRDQAVAERAAKMFAEVWKERGEMV